MFFNVSGLVQEGIGATRFYDVEGTVEVEKGVREQVAGTVEMLRTKVGVLVRAHLRLVEPEICSRCLNPVDEAIAIDFEEEFVATTDLRSSAQMDEEHDPDAFTIDERHMLDLTEAVRQYREVSLEMQPLCRPDCAGLCPRCGSDLNLGECQCDQGPIDSRWSGLAAFRGAISEGKD
jgi:uncharacterized protein